MSIKRPFSDSTLQTPPEGGREGGRDSIGGDTKRPSLTLLISTNEEVNEHAWVSHMWHDRGVEGDEDPLEGGGGELWKKGTNGSSVTIQLIHT